MSGQEQVVLDADEIERIVRRIASAIVEQTRGTERLALVGIRRGGVGLASRLAAAIGEIEAREVPVGTVDIALYRD
ncbi:MAG: phosphoribosyltransferase family protein, partial [Polyangiales bacterium]